MTSFISAFSLLMLVLANVCFTVPIVDEQSWNSTLSSLNDDLTTEKVLHLLLVSDDETTVLPSIEPKRSFDEHIGFELSSSTDSLSAEDASRASRTFDEFSTAETFTSTIEGSLADKRDHDELLLTTVESITEALEHALRSFNKGSEDENQKGDYDHSWSTKSKPNEQTSQGESQNTKSNSEVENIKREIEVESTTSFLPSFTSTSSAVAPELYTSTSLAVDPKLYTSESSTSTSSSSSSSSSSSTSTSTEKYTGLLTDDEDEEQQQQKPKKTHIKSKVTTTKRSQIQSEEDLKESQSKVTRTTTRKSKIQSTDRSEEEDSRRKFTTTKKSKVQSTDKSGEDSTDASIPIALFDQEALQKVSNVPNDFMILEENDDTIVTDLPDKLSTITMENPTKQKALTQGQKSSQSEEKESNN